MISPEPSPTAAITAIPAWLKRLALAALAGTWLSLCQAPRGLAQQPLAGRPEVEAFLDELASRHQIDRKVLAAQFAGVSTDPEVIQLMQPIPPGKRSWTSYRASHVNPERVRAGRLFFAQHRSSLMAAQRASGVPAQIITAILGIETNYGGYKGTFQVLRSLATLSFDSPDRADEFRPQLVDLVLLARDQGQSPGQYLGSYAGAMGYPQFMPTAWRTLGVDGDGDGKVDLINSVDDAIFSVGNFLRHHGWTPGAPVAIPISLPSQKALEFRALPNADKPNLSLQQLRQAQVKPLTGTLINTPAILVDLPTPTQPTEYWVGYPNFYTLMQYNRMFFYAMAVYQLGQEIIAN